ncbi:MAG TPA: DegT/DnrJ/EryC1/StrS family aminotransferase [Myxococcota bacterium]|jgi:dTDP-4-amino-4,6-dideoxygalactose transaminase|nr:DegT/DnrJ/EryC1/StrS family aminotransferase [Myxococcota bacterium]
MGARIPILDLSAEWAEVGADVEAAVVRVLRSGQYILGPETAALEKDVADLVGTRHCVGVGSGTEALWLALVALGIGAGDEVVTSPFTYFATVEAILWAGATPVFADVERESFNLDPGRLEAALGPRTKAILPVHLFGRCADMARIGAIAAARGIAVVEDAAQAIGAARGGRRAGSFGRAGCFSFYPSKNLGAAGDGGCVTTDDDGLAERLRLLRAHGSPRRDVHECLGTTSRLDAVQAAVLRAKLPRLEGWTAARARRAARYAQALAGCGGVTTPGAGRDEVHVWNQYTIRCREAPRVRAALEAEGVEWRHYYPTPAWAQPALAGRGRLAAPCPETEAACREVLSLPIHPHLAPEDVDRIARVIRSALE